LTDYQVNIKTKNADAVVNIKMTVKDEKNNISVIGMGTSPDILVASIETFEEGVNLLCNRGS